MAQPPRIPNWLSLEQETVYFLTLCVEKREPVLTNAPTWEVIRQELIKLDKYKIFCALAMPDHMHLLVAPFSRDASMSDFSRWFKRGVNTALKPSWKWQKGCFDRLLRSNESREEKWNYIRHNPIRAQLVQNLDEWPYQFYDLAES